MKILLLNLKLSKDYLKLYLLKLNIDIDKNFTYITFHKLNNYSTVIIKFYIIYKLKINIKQSYLKKD
jgi:predicted transport protein